MPAVAQAAFTAALLPDVVYTISQGGAAAVAYDITGTTSQGAAFDSGPLGRPNVYLPPGTYTFTPVSANGPAVTVVVPASSTVVVGYTPTAAAGANAGTSPPAPVVTAGASNVRGNITFGTGTTPAAGAQVVVTFAPAGAYATAPLVQATWANSGSAALGAVTVSGVTTTQFTVNCQTAPAASQANTVYSVNFLVTG